MSENIGPMTLGHRQEEVFLGRDLAHGRNYSEEVAASIDKEVRNIIDKCYDRAKNILSENINKLHNVAQALLEREKLNKIEFQEVFAGSIKLTFCQLFCARKTLRLDRGLVKL